MFILLQSLHRQLEDTKPELWDVRSLRQLLFLRLHSVIRDNEILGMLFPKTSPIIVTMARRNILIGGTSSDGRVSSAMCSVMLHSAPGDKKLYHYQPTT
ncbi:hypothetical protein ES702_03056 [subsurface metagenome]